MKTQHRLNILGRDLVINSEETAEHIQAVEELLTERLSEIGQGGVSTPMYNTVLLTALNLAGDLIREREKREAFRERIRDRTSALLDRMATGCPT
jgi:cell division protein ZapA (FtsZ GTPase activity inhibitor)